ncbi:hypothetical protein ACFWA5_03240 [Streptomyces mirabilis]
MEAGGSPVQWRAYTYRADGHLIGVEDRLSTPAASTSTRQAG